MLRCEAGSIVRRIQLSLSVEISNVYRHHEGCRFRRSRRSGTGNQGAVWLVPAVSVKVPPREHT